MENAEYAQCYQGQSFTLDKNKVNCPSRLKEINIKNIIKEKYAQLTTEIKKTHPTCKLHVMEIMHKGEEGAQVPLVL